MANHLNADAIKWVLKEYWKSQNAETIRIKWVETFGTQAPKRQTIYSIRDKFDTTGSILNAPVTGDRNLEILINLVGNKGHVN
jgi:hypothetical protein